ncbi:mismatch-specific DNA-glycosylase [Lacibacter sp.]|uniref:mismatch-specific DNA-glycosylase n=1 Tax=Lacibacter sp. TaxID=1915409 RepID=UPI002B4AC390|nr:mismatch-specific DNA-glycosylase [Lacibacter sp.]HLP37050.1 mismatch-specific DNA-glycosylase [Lacibacter sp.]
MKLPDLLIEDLDVVFCGTAAGDKSAELKAYYAGPGNQFYSIINSVGFTPIKLLPSQFPDLLNYRIGLTDIAKFAQGVDAKLKSSDFDVMGFKEKIIKYQPKYVCFNGKEAARVFYSLKQTKNIKYGIQTDIIKKTKLFVAPSTSGSARGYWDENVWKELFELLKNRKVHKS